jgi:hypothetical protein
MGKANTVKGHSFSIERTQPKETKHIKPNSNGNEFASSNSGFTEIPQARLNTMQRAILGMAFMAVATAATTTPVFVNQFILKIVLGLPVAIYLTRTIAGAISSLCYRSASTLAEKLYAMGVN